MQTRIKFVRLDADLNQAKFGELIGVAQSTVAGWENGTRSVSDAAVRSICREFGISEVWLRTGIGEMRPPNTRAEELGRAIRELLTDDTDSFRTRLLTVLLRFDPDGPEWEILERIVDAVAGENKKSPEP